MFKTKADTGKERVKKNLEQKLHVTFEDKCISFQTWNSAAERSVCSLETMWGSL